MENRDYGTQPYVVDIGKLTNENRAFRAAKWTGEYLQMTIMSIPVDSEVGLEVHDDHDQFLHIESGTATVLMGPSEDNLDFEQNAEANFAIFVPAGKWHNIINSGQEPLKLYSIYAPGEHPAATLHQTQGEATKAE